MLPFLGILAQRWRLFSRTIVAEPEKVALLVKAICVLHNMLRTIGNQSYTSPGFADAIADGHLCNDFWCRQSSVQQESAVRLAATNSTNEAISIRKHFTRYFVSDHGSIEWQWAHINQL